MTDYPVRATRKTFLIIENLAEMETAGVTELADRMDLSKSAVHNHLGTLERLDIVINEDGRYRLGLRLLGLGMQARDGMDVMTAAPHMIDSLGTQSGELASFVVPEFGMAVYMYLSADTSDQLRLGSRLPLHATAAGKAILAFRTQDDPNSYITNYGLDARTARTLTENGEFRNELQSVRDQGLAFDRGEVFTDRRAVAAPVRDSSEKPVGAVSVSGSADRLSGKRLEEDLSGMVLSTASELQLEIRS
jgi:DNA-binding IclR family transcriptional regulator